MAPQLAIEVTGSTPSGFLSYEQKLFQHAEWDGCVVVVGRIEMRRYRPYEQFLKVFITQKAFRSRTGRWSECYVDNFGVTAEVKPQRW